jgi:hypothetical protein
VEFQYARDQQEEDQDNRDIKTGANLLASQRALPPRGRQRDGWSSTAIMLVTLTTVGLMRTVGKMSPGLERCWRGVLTSRSAMALVGSNI